MLVEKLAAANLNKKYCASLDLSSNSTFIGTDERGLPSNNRVLYLDLHSTFNGEKLRVMTSSTV
jgi:hypothetical protein